MGLRRPTAPSLAVWIAVLSSAGCQLVMDLGTHGYTLAADAGSAQCLSAADCDGGSSCCAIITTNATLTTACETTCPSLGDGVGGVKVCASDDECGGESCVDQSCEGVGVRACGVIPLCTLTAIDATSALPGDGGTTDASVPQDIDSSSSPDASSPGD